MRSERKQKTLFRHYPDMPSRNSINKPKDTINQARKRASASKKRAARARSGLLAPPRSAAESTSGQPKSTALALYNGTHANHGAALTRTTLSKKRLNKIERNKRYIAKRKELEDKLLIDATAQAEESMDIDEEVVHKKADSKQAKISGVKSALWSVIEDAAAESFVVDSTGQGTTLGGPSFF